MACHAGPKVSESGLVLALDAANSVITLSTVEVLVVAGGGAGGGYHGGGGGGGGVIYSSAVSVTPGSAVTVTVGDGGTAATSGSNTGNPGSNSVFGSLTAIGGGAGISQSNEAVSRNNGGSGGGGCDGSASVNHPGGSGTSGQGFKGGDVFGSGPQLAVYYGTAGGGGAGGVGGDGGVINGGFGGPGLPFVISGNLAYYGGGGGGTHLGSADITNYGIGGIGGGGTGGISSNPYNSAIRNSSSGVNGTGGGGGGHLYNNLGGGAGGSGIVIVRYPGPQKAIGGTVTSRGGYTIHTFTSVGSTTFTPLSASSGSAISGLTDISNNGNFGTPVNGPTYSGANGGSVVFDGVDDYVTCGTPSISAGKITVNAWVNIITGSLYQHIVDSSSSSWHLAILNDNRPYFYNGSIWHQAAPILTVGQWYMLTGVQGTTLDIYINGVLGQSIATDVSVTTNAVNLGRYQGVGRQFSGRIANTQIYNRALSAAEIQQNYIAMAPRFVIPSIVTSGLVLNLDAGNTASYPGSGTTWTDVSGNGRTGTLTNGPTYSSANGGSIVFDGVDDYISITQTLTTPFTITGFVRYTDQAKIMNMYMNTTPHTVLGISLNRTGVGDLYVYIGNGSSWIGAPGIISSQNMIVNQWYQVTFTSTGSGSILYLNGVNVGTSVYSPSGWGSSYYLGGAIEVMRGNIATTQIYNRALSADEIQQNFNATRGRFNI
jgi:hypothetical protein